MIGTLSEDGMYVRFDKSFSVMLNGVTCTGSAIPIQWIDSDWEEVVERDWEVDSLVFDKQIFVYRNADGTFSPPDTRLIETGVTFSLDGLIEANYSIHSVRRLSDNVCFTVGDTVLHKNNVTKRWAKIEYFHIMPNGIWVKTDEYDVPLSFIHSKVDEAPRKPLFLTEDKVSIFEGDTFFLVGYDLQFITYDFNKEVTAKGDTSYHFGMGGEKTFSTLESANEYILMNSKILTLTEVEAEYNEWLANDDSRQAFFDTLKQLAKSKLK